MLEADAERRVAKLANNIERRIGVLDIIVRQFLSVQLFCRSERERNGFLRSVEFRVLMRVLAVTQALFEIVFEEQFLIQAGSFAHICCDTHVVFGSMGISLGAQLQTRLLLRVAFRLNLTQDAVIIAWIANDRHVIPVLRCRAQHRRTADIDLLDSLRHSRSLFGNRLTERIEIDAHKVDQLNAVLSQSRHVRRFVTTRQKSAMHFRMQGLDAAVADLRKTRYFADADGLHAALFQQFLRTAGGDDLPSCSLQALDELHQTGLIAYAH